MTRSKLVTSAVFMALALVTAARPGTAQCPQLEPSFTITGVTGTGSVQTSADQATLGIGGCATLSFKIVSQPGSVVTDVTHSANTTFTTDPTRGTITGNVFCVGPADCGHQFPVYGIYRDPCSGTTLVATVHITVAPCPVVSPAAGCPQVEAAAYVRSVSFKATINSSDQVTLGIPGCVFVGLVVTRQSNSGTTTEDVTFSPNTSFTAGGVPGIVSPFGANSFCTEPAACGHQFPIYATYHDTCTGTTITSTIHVTVIPCPVVAPAVGCPQLEPLFSVAGVTNGTQTSADQATVNVGGCVTLRLLITAQPGGTTDVTNSPNTTFTTNPTQGTFTSKNVWCATAADCNHQFPIYATYHDPCTGTTITSTVHITVSPCGVGGVG